MALVIGTGGTREVGEAAEQLKKRFSREKGMRKDQKRGWVSGGSQEQEIIGEGKRKEQREVRFGLGEMWRA